MMRKMAVLLLSVLWVTVLACGGSKSGSTSGGQDATTDADSGGGRDLAEEVAEEPDVVEEAAPDMVEEEPAADVSQEPDLPSTETICDDQQDNDGDHLVDCADPDCASSCEVCNDLVDNNGNDLIDCADPQCSDSEYCPERCANGIDDDADGNIDCADSECAATLRCTEPPVSADDYTFGEMGYFARLQYPPPGVSCCFNFDDDPALDNQLTALLAFIPGYDAQLNMDAVVNQGNLAILIEWKTFPGTFADGGPVNFNIFRGFPTDPAAIGPNENAWADGGGTFQVTRDSFDDRGPRIRFEGATLDTDGVLVGGPNFLDLTIPIPELGLDLTLTVYQARVEMNLEEVSEGTGGGTQIETVPQEATGADGPVTVGGGKLGGYVTADDLLAFLNDAASLCACAAPPGMRPVPPPLFSYGEQPGHSTYQISKNWTPLSPLDSNYTCDESSSALCQPRADDSTATYIGTVASVIPAAPILFDVDANKNGINESLSVGLYFDLVGAHLDDPPLVPAE